MYQVRGRMTTGRFSAAKSCCTDKTPIVVPLLFRMLFLDLYHQTLQNFPVAMLIKSLA